MIARVLDVASPGWKARRFPVSDVDSFRAALARICPGPAFPPAIYRGQSRASWPLQSTWARRYCIVQPAGLSQHYRLQPRESQRVPLLKLHLKTFGRALAECAPDMARLSDDDLWSLGRHHQLVTPLLDWSRSPLIAAHFAVRGLTSQSTQAAAVWALRVSDWELPFAAMWSPERFPRINLRPTNPPLRQRLQQGIFTCLTHVIFSDIESYLNNQVTGGGAYVCLCCLEIAPMAIPAIQAMVEAEGITDEALGINDDASSGATWIDEIAARCNALLPPGIALS